MMTELAQIAYQAKESISASSDLSVLESLRVQYLGKKGELTGLLKGLGSLSADDRPAAGAAINDVKQRLQVLIDTKKKSLGLEALNAKLAGETIDVTLPGRGEDVGGLIQ